MNLNISQLNFATNWTCPSKYGPSKYDWSFANDAWLVSIWWNSSHAIRVVRHIWIRCITFHNKNNKKNGSGFIFPYFLACAFAYDRGVRFPGFFQLASSLLGFSYRATHISFVFRLRVRPTCDSPIYSSVSIKEFFNKAFVWFYFVCTSLISKRIIVKN